MFKDVPPHRQTPKRGWTKAQRLAYERMIIEAYALQWEALEPWDHEVKVPEAWATLEQDMDVTEKKMQVTLRLDTSVAKYYRAMGPGYQARINRILATYAQMKIAEVHMADDRLARFRAEERVRKAAEAEAGSDVG